MTALFPGEPDLGPWTARPVSWVADTLIGRGLARRAAALGTKPHRGGPLVVAVDGRSGGGKTSTAAALAAATERSCVVHTDDLAWNDSFFGWHELLVDGVLRPASQEVDVRLRPPAWHEHGRDGAVTVPIGTRLLVVEGVGAARRELRGWLDAVVWVQSDRVEAERRGIERDVTLGRTPAEAEAFWREWEEHEVPLLAAHRPWEIADLVVYGTPAEGADEPPARLSVSRARAAAARPARRTS